MNYRITRNLLITLACLLSTVMPQENSAGVSGMVDPAVDLTGEPFSYYSHPVTVIGAVDAPEGTEVTPEGFLYTGFAELIFFLGDPPVPLSRRIKRLEDGYLPIVSYHLDNYDVRATVNYFAACLDGTPQGRLVNFVRIRLENLSRRPQSRSVWIGLRFQPPERDLITGTPRARFRRVIPDTPGYRQAGEIFDYDWDYRMDRDLVGRDGRAVYFFSPEVGGVEVEKYLTFGIPWDGEAFAGRPVRNITPSTPVCLTRFRFDLPGGAADSLEVRMPYFPVELDRGSAIDSVRSADFDRHLSATRRNWSRLLNNGMDIRLPEAKVSQTFKASFVYQLIARDREGDDYVQRANEFQYDGFFIDEAALAARSYDLAGHPVLAQQTIAYLVAQQREDGNFISEPSRFHEFGTALWAISRHALISGDPKYAERLFPVVQRAMRWLRSARRRDPLGVVPVAMAGNPENLSGHVTGHTIWALAGAEASIELAAFLGRRSDLNNFRSYTRALRRSFAAALKKAAADAGGLIPPGLDGPGGEDWGNLMALWPQAVLDPSDKFVAATMAYAEGRTAEGLMTYLGGRFLHHPLSVHLAGSHLVMGEQKKTLETLYNLLVHTSSTHAGFHTDIPVWGSRDFGDNLSPYGGFHSRYIMLLRDMLIRERDDDLVLLSAISPAWIKPGDKIAVSQAPTDFGTVSYSLEAAPESCIINIDAEFRRPPKRIILTRPWFIEFSSATADSVEIKIDTDYMELKPEARRVVIQWDVSPVNLSYERAVSDYLEEYRRRFEIFLETGG